MKKWIASACFMALAAAGSSQNARAASVAVDVNITMPGILVLYCYDDIAININAATLASVLGVTNDSGISVSGVAGPTGGPTSPSAGNLTADMDLDTNAAAVPTTVNLLLQDTCGVRAIASGSAATITVSGVAPTLVGSLGPASGTIAVSSVTTSDSGASGLALTGGFAAINTFDVTMALDLGAVNAPDTFSSAGSEFTINVGAP